MMVRKKKKKTQISSIKNQKRQMPAPNEYAKKKKDASTGEDA
jgi:hypothetical protein